MPKTTTETKVLTSPLKVLFNEMKENLITEQEALQNNITAIFWRDCETTIKAKEQINIQFRGPPANGKSTAAAAVMMKVNKDYLKIPKEVLEKGNELISSDQLEFLRWIKQGAQNICIQIDEWNDMGQTGYNATTEMMLFDYYSNVFAQRFVHRIACSPTQIIDRNCYCFLDVEGRDLEKKITRCKLTFRDIVTNYQKVLGYVDIPVADVINQKWYAKYREKKFKRMELLEKHGQRSIIEPEMSYIALKAIKELNESSVTIKHDIDTIKSTVEMVSEEEGRIYSILTTMNIASKAKSLIYLKHKINRQEEKALKVKDILMLTEINKGIESLKVIYGKLMTKLMNNSELYITWVNTQ